MRHPLLACCVLAGLLASVEGASASAARTFVATTGADTNAGTNCGATAPCRTFGAALAATAPGGELVVLNSGGYGPMTITQSVTVTVPDGVYAGISVASGTGIVVNGSGITVNLRGLSLNGTGGSTGIDFQNGQSLNVERSTFANFTLYGVLAEAGGSLKVVDSVFRDCLNGVWIQDYPTAAIVGSKFLGTLTGTTRTMYNGVMVFQSVATSQPVASVEDCLANEGVLNGYVAQAGLASTAAANTVLLNVDHSSASGGSYGIWTGGNGGSIVIAVSNSTFSNLATAGVYAQSTGTLIYVNNSTITDSAIGLSAAYGGIAYTYGNNSLAGNTTDFSATPNGIVTTLLLQ